MFCRDAAVDGREKQGCESFCTPSDTCVNVPDNWNDQASTAITDTGYACLTYECVPFYIISRSSDKLLKTLFRRIQALTRSMKRDTNCEGASIKITPVAHDNLHKLGWGDRISSYRCWKA